MKKLLIVALPFCMLLSCSSDPAKKADAPDNPKAETRELPVPDKKAYPELDDYDYLVKYIGAAGTKKPENSDCVWSQQFDKGITYDMLNCVESNGYNYRITFDGYEKEQVVRFVEWFNASNDMAWDRDETVFGPKDDGMGCYFRVARNKAGNYYMECTCVC